MLVTSLMLWKKRPNLNLPRGLKILLPLGLNFRKSLESLAIKLYDKYVWCFLPCCLASWPVKQTTWSIHFLSTNHLAIRNARSEASEVEIVFFCLANSQSPAAVCYPWRLLRGLLGMSSQGWGMYESHSIVGLWTMRDLISSGCSCNV